MRPLASDIPGVWSAKSGETIMPKMVDLNMSWESIANVENPAQWGFDQNQIAGY